MTAISAIDAVPYVLLGESRRAALKTALADCLMLWQRRWAVAEAPAPAVEVLTDYKKLDAVLAGNPQEVRATAQGKMQLSVLVSGISPAVMAGLTALDSAHCGPLSKRLQTDMLVSLCEALASESRIGGVDVISAPTDTRQLAKLAVQSRAIAVEVSLSRPGANIYLLVSSGALERLAPRLRSVKSSTPLMQRGDAVHEQTIRVNAILGEAQLSLRDLASLAPGDVIVLQESLVEPSQLQVTGGAIFARAVLGCSGGKKALRISHVDLKRVAK